ncbi:hypothetical protein SBA4_4360003 [Candidatus Sulfopaludibacter sp. SbA4]|nr:hypothetical protein SBA4_4360003 [Candidatus Sulfopaludibacter sp. SbA4]
MGGWAGGGCCSEPAGGAGGGCCCCESCAASGYGLPAQRQADTTTRLKRLKKLMQAYLSTLRGDEFLDARETPLGTDDLRRC